MDTVLIYDRIVMDADGKVLEAHVIDYDGEIALCKGGGGSTTTVTQEVDKEYNARMAAVAERAQTLSDEYYAWWQNNQAPLEKAEAEAQLSLLPSQTKLNQSLLNMQNNTIGTTSKLATQFLDQSLNGVNKEEWANRAGTDQQVAASNVMQQMTRNASRMGLNANSGAFAKAMTDQSLGNAANVATARTQAYRQADDENYKRLQGGLSAGMGLISQS